MKFTTLECVALARNIPEHGLRIGDLGTVVETYEPDDLEVEFVAASGDTIAVVTPAVRDVRKVSSADIVAARPASP